MTTVVIQHANQPVVETADFKNGNELIVIAQAFTGLCGQPHKLAYVENHLMLQAEPFVLVALCNPVVDDT